MGSSWKPLDVFWMKPDSPRSEAAGARKLVTIRAWQKVGHVLWRQHWPAPVPRDLWVQASSATGRIQIPGHISHHGNVLHVRQNEGYRRLPWGWVMMSFLKDLRQWSCRSLFQDL